MASEGEKLVFENTAHKALVFQGLFGLAKWSKSFFNGDKGSYGYTQAGRVMGASRAVPIKEYWMRFDIEWSSVAPSSRVWSMFPTMRQIAVVTRGVPMSPERHVRGMVPPLRGCIEVARAVRIVPVYKDHHVFCKVTECTTGIYRGFAQQVLRLLEPLTSDNIGPALDDMRDFATTNADPRPMFTLWEQVVTSPERITGYADNDVDLTACLQIKQD